MNSSAMASSPAQAQAGTQQQQALRARLDDPLVTNDFRGEIQDYSDYLDLMAVYSVGRKEEHKIAPVSQDLDMNYPHNDAAKQKQLVERLCNAMRNQTGILDGTLKKDANKEIVLDDNGLPVKKENAIIRRSREIPNIVLEMIAWGFLISIKDAQEGALYPLEWALDRTFEYEYYPTFMDRFTAAEASLKVSKKAVSDLTEASWPCRLASAPAYEVDRKKVNQRVNGNKQVLLTEATSKRKRDRQEQEDQELEGNDDGVLGNLDTQATPANTRKTATRRPARKQKQSEALQGLNQQAEVVPPTAPAQQAGIALQRAVNSFAPTLGPTRELGHNGQLFASTNALAPPATAYHAPCRPELTSASLESSPLAWLACGLQQPNYLPQLPSASSGPDQVLNTMPVQHTQFPRASENFLSQADIFGAPFMQQTASSAGTVPSHIDAPTPGTQLAQTFGNTNFLPQANSLGSPFAPVFASTPTIPSLATTPAHFGTSPLAQSNYSETPYSSAPRTPSNIPPVSQFQLGEAVQAGQGDKGFDVGFGNYQSFQYPNDLPNGDDWMLPQM